MKASARTFRQVMSRFATGVTVVTTLDSRGRPYGLTVNSFASVSLRPLLILVCLDREVSGLEHFEQGGRMAVNILADDQEEASVFFAQPGSDRSEFDYFDGKTGVPLLRGCLAALECEVTESFPGGDHRILVGRVEEVSLRHPEKKPLVFYQGRYTSLDEL